MKVSIHSSCGKCEAELQKLRLNKDLLSDAPDVTLIVGKTKDSPLPENAILCGRCAINSATATHTAHGCPVNIPRLVYTLNCIKDGITPKQSTLPVCMECKLKENPCLIKKGLPCKGPITISGCNAKCPTQGAICTGCFGQTDKASAKLWEELVLYK